MVYVVRGGDVPAGPDLSRSATQGRHSSLRCGAWGAGRLLWSV